MKKNLIALALLFSPVLFADVLPGDIAIVSVNSDNNDSFQFVALSDIAAGEAIRFTDNGILDDGTFRTGEGYKEWSYISTLIAGTVVRFDGTSFDIGTTGTSGIYSASASGDELIAYDGTDQTSILFAMHYANTTSWLTGTGDPGTTNSYEPAFGYTFIPGSMDNYVYSGITSGTQNAILTAILDPSNWTGDSSPASDLIFNGTFTIVPEPAALSLSLLCSCAFFRRRQ